MRRDVAELVYLRYVEADAHYPCRRGHPACAPADGGACTDEALAAICNEAGEAADDD